MQSGYLKLFLYNFVIIVIKIFKLTTSQEWHFYLFSFRKQYY